MQIHCFPLHYNETQRPRLYVEGCNKPTQRCVEKRVADRFTSEFDPAKIRNGEPGGSPKRLLILTESEVVFQNQQHGARMVRKYCFGFVERAGIGLEHSQNVATDVTEVK